MGGFNRKPARAVPNWRAPASTGRPAGHQGGAHSPGNGTFLFAVAPLPPWGFFYVGSWLVDDGGGFFQLPEMALFFSYGAIFFSSLTTKINGATSFLLTKM